MNEPNIEDYLKILVVQQQRIYDVLLVLLAESNKTAFTNIVNLHKEFQGGPGPAPYLEG
jgi:hypothetical protein